MGLAFSGELSGWPCGCDPGQGTNPAGTGVQYVISLNGLGGIVTLAAGGGVAISSTGNSILIASDGSAGLGTVTTVDATSSNANLVVTGGPITTVGTFAFSLAGNLDSISGLTMAADQMLYSTGPGVFVATSLTAFGRSLIDDAAAVNARSTLGLVIGTDVQAFSQDLSDFVSAASWPAGVLTLSSGLTLSGAAGLTLVSANITGIGADFTDNITVGDSIVVTNSVTAASFAGSGVSLTNLNASQLASGIVAVARGGTGLVSYAVGDIIYAAAATTLNKLVSVSAGSYLRSGGVTTAPVWSTLKLPNTAVVGDILYASSLNTIGNLADVATGSVLCSGGVGVAPLWDQVTSARVDTGTIATISGGVNANISAFSSQMTFADQVGFSSTAIFSGEVWDGAADPGTSGYIFTSTGTGVSWTNQIVVDTIRIDTVASIEATITAGGVTGDQTINKAMGSVNIAAGNSSITVTNSLVEADTCVFCQIATNDTTAILKNVVASSGQFVIRTTANVTAETRINFVLYQPT